MLFGMLVLLGVGILFFVFGWLLWGKQKISLVHEYHTRNVKKEDVPAYTRLMGLGMLAIGAGCVFTGVVALGLARPLGWLGLPAGLIVGFSLFFRAQRRYNEGRFIS